MLSRCGRRLLHVLGLSFPLLTRQPLFLCLQRLMKPLVVFVLGGPGAGKGTQCARIVEVRPWQLAGSLGVIGRRAALSSCARSSAPPGAVDPRTTSPGDHRVSRVAVVGTGSPCPPNSGAPVMKGDAWGQFVPSPLFPYILGTKFISRGLGERSREGQPPGTPSVQRSVCLWGWSGEGSSSSADLG